MLSSSTGLIVTFVALAAFAIVGIWGAVRGGRDRDAYLTARGSQGAWPLALSFFASVLGAWILFAPPEVGTFGGLAGIAGYAVGQAVAVAAFAVLGPRLRDRLPAGSTILEWVRLRFGSTLGVWVGGVSVLYMFVFLTAELTAIGGVLALMTGTPSWIVVVGVAGVTAAYTAYGGLVASIATDRWQAVGTVVLAGLGVVAIATAVTDPVDLAVSGGITRVDRTGVETAVVLVIAITAANLFHQGFWQRVWAARDSRALVRGAIGAGALIAPLLFVVGATGTIAAGAGLAADVPPSLAFFGLLDGLGPVWLVIVVALAVTLVTSTVDTLQNALTSLVAVHVGAGRIPLPSARWVTIGLTVPAVAIAVQELSVLRLFLVADLLAATIAVPVFSGLWKRVPASGALAGSVAGLAAVVGWGWFDGGTLGTGLRLLTLPGGVPDLGAFVAAVVGSSVVTLGWTLVVRNGRPDRAPDATAAPAPPR